MKNTFKRIIPLLATILLVCSVCLGVMACSKPAAKDYNVTVVYEDNTAVNGTTDGIGGVNPETGDALTQVLVQFCNKESGQCATPVLLGTDGKLTISSATLENSIGTGTYQVKLIGLKGQYYYDIAEVTSSSTSANITVKEYDYSVFAATGDIEITGKDEFEMDIEEFVPNGKGLANVYFAIGYLDADYMRVYEYYGITGEDGYAYFDFTPSLADVNYEIWLAAEDDTVDVIPLGYDAYIVDDVVLTEGVSAYTLNFVDNTDSFMFAEITPVPYTRVPGATEPVETKEDLTVTINPGEVKYFSFTPYVKPEGVEEDTLASLQAIEAAQWAANGVYKIQFNNDNIVAQAFNDIQTTFYDWDGDGMPDYLDYNNTNGLPHVDANSEEYESGNYLFYDLHTGIVAKENGFYVTLADGITEAQQVTISVVRVTVAREIIVEEEDIAIANFAPDLTGETPEGEWTLAPVDGSFKAVLGIDGYYHLGSEAGPMLYATINKPNDRVANVSFSEIPNGDGTGSAPGTTAFSYSEYKDEVNGTYYTKKIYSYYKAIMGDGVNKGYAELCNNDGTYPINEQLYTILNKFCLDFTGYMGAATNYEWLLACGYYAEQHTVTVPANGVKSNEITLTAGTWLITLTTIEELNNDWFHISDPNALTEYDYADICDPLNPDNNYQVIVTVDEDTNFVLVGSESRAINVTLTFALTVEATPTLSVNNPVQLTVPFYYYDADSDTEFGTPTTIDLDVAPGTYQLVAQVNPMSDYGTTIVVRLGFNMITLNNSNNWTAVFGYHPSMGTELVVYSDNRYGAENVTISIMAYAPEFDLGVGEDNLAYVNLHTAGSAKINLDNVPEGSYTITVTATSTEDTTLVDNDVYVIIDCGGEFTQLDKTNNFSASISIPAGTEYIEITHDYAGPDYSGAFLTFLVTLTANA